MIDIAFPSTESKATPHPHFTIDDLVERVRWAAVDNDVAQVGRVLEQAIGGHPEFLPEKFLRSKAEGYARREIYSDPDGRFSMLAMVWEPGQGTPLHDHGGLWVVEVVYRGIIAVTNYTHLGVHDGLHRFEPSEERLDERGVSDWRFPPDEHHLLCNAGSAPAVTIHVFGGILKNCNIFESRTGGYKKIPKTMCLDC